MCGSALTQCVVAMQVNHTAQLVQGFATMLQVPASAIVSVAIANNSQQQHATPSATLAAASVNASATSVAASANQAVTVIIHPPASNSSNASVLAAGALTAPTVARLLGSADATQSQSALGFAVVQVTQSYRVGICGNGICEVGERGIVGNSSQDALEGSCPADCPVQYSACPSNQSVTCNERGRCLSSEGVCNCFPG